ncbi:hypothetical protein Hanom_Chr05g00395781 [Helianthus anomalus]
MLENNNDAGKGLSEGNMTEVDNGSSGQKGDPPVGFQVNEASVQEVFAQHLQEGNNGIEIRKEKAFLSGRRR